MENVKNVNVVNLPEPTMSRGLDYHGFDVDEQDPFVVLPASVVAGLTNLSTLGMWFVWATETEGGVEKALGRVVSLAKECQARMDRDTIESFLTYTTSIVFDVVERVGLHAEVTEH